MVKKGATTWWERWNGDTGDPSMNSYNHYAFGSVMAWVYRRAAGIDTDTAGPGFHHLTVHPHFDASLPQLHVEYDSAYGTIVSDWQASQHRFTVTVPPNTTATARFPAGIKADKVREAGRPLEWDIRNGVIIRKARAHGLATPISDVVVPLLAAAGDGPG